MRRWRFALAGLAVLGGPLVAQGALAQEGTPEPPEGCEVVAEGLANPRQLAFGTDGTLYVTEAGTGGDEVLPPPEEEEVEEVIGTPAAEEIEEAATPPPGEEEGPPATRGDTGQVTAVAPDGTQSVVATGLPSYSEGLGPTGIVAADGVLWVAVGGAAPFLGIEPLENESSILSIDPATGTATLVAELGSFEVANNPDGTDVNPNLYGMDLGADGQLYVADAGGNTVYRVDPATGTFALLGVVPGLPLPQGATPSPDQPAPHSVPTAVDVAADGNVYVGLLDSFLPDQARIMIAQADGTFIEAASGLNAVVGVALGPDGALYASQITTDIENFGPGSVVRIGAEGTAEPVLEDLAAPNGIAFGADGALYVVANSVAFGPGEPQGQVLRCELAAGGEAGTPAASAARIDA